MRKFGLTAAALTSSLIGGLASLLPASALAVHAESAKINDPARGFDHLWHEVIVDVTVISGTCGARPAGPFPLGFGGQ